MKTKGKILLVALTAFAFLLIMKGLSVYAYVGSTFTYSYENNSFTYKVLSEPTGTKNGTAELIYTIGFNETLEGKVTIPSAVINQNMTYDVTTIGEYALMDAEGVTSIDLPDKVTNIGIGAFSNCTNLISVNLPATVIEIENNAFNGCSSLKSVALPDKLTSIGSYAFSFCSSLTDVNLPSGVTKIGTGAFNGCSSLTEINIPEGVTVIPDLLFKDCVNLAAVSLPEGITSIGKEAFYDCYQLKRIHLSDTITSIGESAFYKCTSLTSIKVPYGVTEIKDSTFSNCSGLTSIRIQDKVTSIGNFAFMSCRSLLSINLPEGVTSIGNWVFYGCESLRPIQIPASVTSIGSGEFPYCGVTVYQNSYAETFFEKNFPDYYQIIKVPLEEMTFSEQVMQIAANETVNLQPSFYPVNSSEITDSITWSSSNPSLVSVDSKGAVKGLGEGEADITAVMGNYSATCHIVVGGTAVNPVSIVFGETTKTMTKGESARLLLNFTPQNSTNQKITWSSSNSSVVTVENGRIYAIGSGTATVTAKSANASAECRITVENPLKEIFTDYQEIVVKKGESKKLAVSYDPMDTTDDKTTVWKSGNDSVATVQNGVLTAVKPGTTTITAIVGNYMLDIPVTVRNPVISLSMKQTEITLTAGQTFALPIALQPADTSDILTVTSSDETVATCSDSTITALKGGEATITVTCGSWTVSCVVTVETDIDSITLNKESLNMTLGSDETLSVAFTPANAVDDRTVTWTSSNKNVVTVNAQGKVQTVGTGTATVTAIAGGEKKAVCTVTVKLSVPKSLKTVSGGYDRIKLSWGTVSGVSGYQISRSDSKTGTYKLVKTTTAASYTDTGLTAGKTYYYKVRGYRMEGTQKVYGTFTAVVGTKPIPSVPANVKLAKVSSGKVNFTWNSVSGATGYEVYRASTRTTDFRRVTTTVSKHYINYGLTKGVTYYYKVRAYKIVGKTKVYGKFSTVFAKKM